MQINHQVKIIYFIINSKYNSKVIFYSYIRNQIQDHLIYPVHHQIQLGIQLFIYSFRLFFINKIVLLIKRNASHANTRQNRFSSSNIFGNNKPPFAHSPNNPIHPDHNGITVNRPNDIRSQMHQRVWIQILVLI